MSEDQPNSHIISLTAQIVSAHVSNNAIQADALPALILSVYKTLTGTGVETPQPEKRQPAVAVKRSVFPDYIVCLEDGKKLKMLKRHLKTAYDMTPDQYRARWGLPLS
jgi:predicted transcriptional regulator